jgi:hypothetical protein
MEIAAIVDSQHADQTSSLVSTKHFGYCINFMFTTLFKVCLENLIYYFSKLMYIKNNNMLGMNSYVCMFFQIPAQILDLDGMKDILFSQFSCEKRIFLTSI